MTIIQLISPEASLVSTDQSPVSFQMRAVTGIYVAEAAPAPPRI